MPCAREGCHRDWAEEEGEEEDGRGRRRRQNRLRGVVQEGLAVVVVMLAGPMKCTWLMLLMRCPTLTVAYQGEAGKKQDP